MDGQFYSPYALSQAVQELFEYDANTLPVNTRIMGYCDDDLAWISQYVCEGSVNIEKIKSGKEIILMVPAYTLTEDDNQTVWMNHVDYQAEDAINDTNFHVGDTLSLSQLFTEQELNGYFSLTDTKTLFERQDYKVTIGAIIRNYVGWFENNESGPKRAYTLLTSNDAFDALNTPATYSHVRVYLNNDIKNTDEITAIMNDYLNDYPYLKLICMSNDMRTYRQYNFILNVFIVSLLVFCIIASFTVTYSQLLIKTRMNERTYALFQICGDSLKNIIHMLFTQITILFLLCVSISIPLITVVDKYLQWGLLEKVPFSIVIVYFCWLISVIPSICNVRKGRPFPYSQNISTYRTPRKYPSCSITQSFQTSAPKG